MRPINSSHTREPHPHRNEAGGPGRTRGIAVGQGCLLLAIGLALAACNPQKADNDTVVDDNAVENAAQTVRPGGASVDEVRSAANQSPGEEPVVVVSQTSPAHLVDASGNALYALEGNKDGSKCDATCESAWPPVMAHGSRPNPAPGMPPGMLGALPSDDGTLQMTYDGNPLYRYSGDMGQASTAGHGVNDKWGTWHLVGTDGGLITQPVSDPAEGAAAQAPEDTGDDGTEPGTPELEKDADGSQP